MVKASGASMRPLRMTPPKRPAGRAINHQPNPAGPRTTPMAQGANKMAADLRPSPKRTTSLVRGSGTMKPQQVY
jgi:hypothetical protein